MSAVIHWDKGFFNFVVFLQSKLQNHRCAYPNPSLQRLCSERWRSDVNQIVKPVITAFRTSVLGPAKKHRKKPSQQGTVHLQKVRFSRLRNKGCSLRKLDQHKSWWSLSLYRSFVLVTLHSECKAWVIYLDFNNISPGSKMEVPTEMGPKKKPQPPGLVSQPPLEKAPLPRPQHPLLGSNCSGSTNC